MNQGNAVRLLLAVFLQSPTEGAVASAQPSPLPLYGALQESIPMKKSMDADNDDLLSLCNAADLAQDRKRQIDVLERVWKEIFPTTPWKLNKASAQELLKITNGSTEKVFLYLEELRGREDIQWPFSYSKTLLIRKMKDEAQAAPEPEIPPVMRQALEIGARDGDGYTDFRRYIGNTTTGNTKG